MNKPGTKFWLAVSVVVLQMLMFVALLATGQFREGMLALFLGAPVATFTAFGIMNVVASGQPVQPTDPGKAP